MNIQEQLNSLIRGNPLSVDTYLREVCKNEHISDTKASIPQLNLWLEFGASKTTQISLMAMGFTRTAALEFSDLIVDENYNKEQCLHWFQTNNINAMDLPASIINEAGRIIKLQ